MELQIIRDAVYENEISVHVPFPDTPLLVRKIESGALQGLLKLDEPDCLEDDCISVGGKAQGRWIGLFAGRDYSDRTGLTISTYAEREGDDALDGTSPLPKELSIDHRLIVAQIIRRLILN